MTIAQVFDLMSDEDEILAKAAQIELVRQVRPTLRRWIGARVGRYLTREAAEDTEAEVWCRVFKHPEAGYNRTDPELLAWLFTLTRNACRSTLTEEKKRLDRQAALDEARGVPADSESERESRAVRRSLVELGADHPVEFELILARFYYELTWRQIAEAFDLGSEFFAAQAVKRAIRLLQKILEKYL